MRACNLIIVLVSHYQADEAQLIWTYMKRIVFSQHGLLRTSIKYLIFNPFPKRYIQSWTPNLARLVYLLPSLVANVWGQEFQITTYFEEAKPCGLWKIGVNTFDFLLN